MACPRDSFSAQLRPCLIAEAYPGRRVVVVMHGGVVDVHFQLQVRGRQCAGGGQHLERGDGYTIQNVLRNLASGQERLDDQVAQLTVPTLIVWGEQDAMIPVASAREFQRLIPGSQLEVIAECGHLPALEKPAELVRHVLNFLDRSLLAILATAN